MVMRNKLLTKIICIFTICILMVNPVLAYNQTETVGEAKSLVDGIVGYKEKQAGAASVQAWINGYLTKNAGTMSEWYVFALAQSGSYDFSSYEAALLDYLSNNSVKSATSRQKYAIVLSAIGSTDIFISKTMEDSIGQMGVMSWAYGLHLLNNGYTSSNNTIETVKSKILSLQLTDGGWALMGATGDVDVTSMVIQALAPYYDNDNSVKAAIDKAITLLSSRQLETGEFSSYGVPNPESTAQVIVALSALGIDGQNDERFIKNGNTLFDGLKKFKLSDGSFCHKEGDAGNDNATVQVYYSLISYIRMWENKGSLYILDNSNPAGVTPYAPPATDNTEKDNNTTAESATKPISNDNEGNNTNEQETTSKDLSQQETNKNSTSGQDTNNDNTNDQDEYDSANGKEQADTKEETSTSEEEESTEADNGKTDDNDKSNENVEKDVDKKTSSDTNKKNSAGYKIWISLTIIVIAAVISLIMYLKGKRNKKNFIAIAVIALLAIIFVCVTEFRSKDEYYNGESVTKEETIGTVTMTIRCDTIVGEADSEYIPDDGVILEMTEFEIEEGDTVYDILVEAARKYNIQMENSGAEGMVYVSGINYLYEFDYGDLSGWMYFVNGKEASVGCDNYKLSDGDKIEWLYTRNLGEDL